MASLTDFNCGGIRWKQAVNGVADAILRFLDRDENTHLRSALMYNNQAAAYDGGIEDMILDAMDAPMWLYKSGWEFDRNDLWEHGFALVAEFLCMTNEHYAQYEIDGIPPWEKTGYDAPANMRHI